MDVVADAKEIFVKKIKEAGIELLEKDLIAGIEEVVLKSPNKIDDIVFAQFKEAIKLTLEKLKK